jgi:isopentenyl-diphosphate delta-isomerase type 1
MTATEYVVLVDKDDNDLGTAEKLYAHQHNLLHRAFSVFIFRNKPQRELLLQQRALAKYHSPGLWTNTCCSHPRQGESVMVAAQRRLEEELGFTVPLTHVGQFIYNAHFPNGLSEHELDHILIGDVSPSLTIQPNPEEVNAIRWVTLAALQEEMAAHPEHFTPWLAGALKIL